MKTLFSLVVLLTLSLNAFAGDTFDCKGHLLVKQGNNKLAEKVTLKIDYFDSNLVDVYLNSVKHAGYEINGLLTVKNGDTVITMAMVHGSDGIFYNVKTKTTVRKKIIKSASGLLSCNQ